MAATDTDNTATHDNACNPMNEIRSWFPKSTSRIDAIAEVRRHYPRATGYRTWTENGKLVVSFFVVSKP